MSSQASGGVAIQREELTGHVLENKYKSLIRS